MDKHAVRQVLEQIAAFVELKGGDGGGARARAFRAAGRAIAAAPGDLGRAAASGALARIRGVDPPTLEIVRELLVTGRSSVLDELREQVPPGLVEMLRIPGFGVAKVRLVHDRLGIESLTELERAARDGRLATLPRFGSRTAENVLKGIALLREGSEFRLYHYAADEIDGVRRAVAALAGVCRVEVAGSVRRRREVIRDLDLLVEHAGGGARDALVRRLGEAPGVTELMGESGAVTLRFASGTVVAVYLTDPAHLGVAWIRATGSAEHVAGLEARARAMGVDLGGPLADEAAVYAALGLPWIPPELREGAGEIEAAAAGHLPRLVERQDLRGFLHCHSNYSDGTTSVVQWAEAARAAGYEWLGLTDHSQAAPYAGGLRAEDVPRQHAEIDEVNRRLDDVYVFKGVEADILADGTLDYGPAVLDNFDFVIGSVHSRFGMSEGEMTDRVLRALDDPHLTVLGHPTGRLLLAREPFAVDVERVLAHAAERGVAVELNADPHRLDLDWRLVRQARELGVPVSIGADAHSVSGMSNVDVGLGIARKGWLEAAQVLNTRTGDAFAAFARARRTR